MPVNPLGSEHVNDRYRQQEYDDSNYCDVTYFNEQFGGVLLVDCHMLAQ